MQWNHRIISLISLLIISFSGMIETGLCQEKRQPPIAQNKEETQPKTSVPNTNFAGLRETDIGVVTDVINPLTIKLKSGDVIHLTGLDYPDLDYYNPGSLSLTAANVLSDMLVGKKVKLYQTTNIHGQINRMGHRLAQIERTEDGLWVQGTMLSLGLARVRTTPSNSALASEMLKYEAEARKEKIGLWEIPTYAIHESAQAADFIGSYQIIEGTIKNVAMKENRMFINFGDNWKKDFTISITPANRRLFRKAGFDFQNMNGQKIRVRGWISSYNGAYIEITHPQQIEILDTQTSVKLNPELITNNKEKSEANPSDDNNALPDIETTEETDPSSPPKVKKSVTMGDDSILKRATSIGNQ